MKIKKNSLVGFINKVSLNETEKLKEVLFDFQKDGVHVSAMSPTNVSRVDAVLYSSGFEVYDSVGKVAFDDIDTLSKVLSGFDDSIEITINGNLATFSEGNKKVDVELLDEQFINKTDERKEMRHTDSIELDISKFKKFINDVSINKDFNVILTTTENKVRMSNVGKYAFSLNVDCDARGGVAVKFGASIKNCVYNLTDSIRLNLATDYPIEIIEETENSKVSIVTAPRIRQDD